MTLDQFIWNLQKLQDLGHGAKKVFYRHGSSGDCGELSTAFVTNKIDRDTGPFDLYENEEYISIHAGN